MAKNYSIYEAKAKLSELIRIIKNGKEIILTERGTPVARLSPIFRENDLKSNLAQLKNSGLLRERDKNKTLTPLYPDSDKNILSEFLEERE